MNYLSKINRPIVKGIFYLVIGIILGLRGFEIIDFQFTNYLLLALAAYFLAFGLYDSGLYTSLVRQFSSKK